MSPKTVEEVFKVSGVPTYTFVPPSQFNALKVGLRSAGRGVVIEGPSGIGKSTAVARALSELDMDSKVTKLSARVPAEAALVDLLPETEDFGIVVIDDFHRLPSAIRGHLADLLKALADTESQTSKLVIIGINQAGTSLIHFAPDLVNRIDRIHFEVEPPQKIKELISLGETALNLDIEARDHVVGAAQGSFYLAQMLCRDLCIEAGILEEPASRQMVRTTYAAVRRGAMDRQEARFGEPLKEFARGTRFRPSGRAPYLHILKWLADSDGWSISLPDEIRRHATERISVGQVVDKGYLAELLRQPAIGEILHFDESTKVLSVEDPHLIYYLRNLDWPTFVREMGFTKVDFDEPYDIALSFAGEDREFAELLRDELEDDGHAVFYDLAEQHRILAQDIAEYLGPIYKSRARFVVAILGETYGVKRWTIFESEQFKPRIEAGEVIPVWSKQIPASAFDETRRIGGVNFDPSGDLPKQAREIAELISKKLAEA